MEIPKANETPESPDVLLLGPGGSKGFLFLGALWALLDNLNNTKEYIGVSIGSVILLLFIIGVDIIDIISISLTIDMFKEITNIDFKAIKENTGLVPNRIIEELVSSFIIKKFGFIPTFKQLYLFTGVNFQCITYNLTDCKAELLDVHNNPDLSVLKAVIRSSNIPGLFYKIKDDGKIYVDGALGNPYPVDLVDNGRKVIWAMYIEESSDPRDDSILSYFFHVVQAPMREIRRRNIKHSSPKCHHLELQTILKDTTGASFTMKDKLTLIVSGYKQALIFLKRLKEKSDHCNNLIDL